MHAELVRCISIKPDIRSGPPLVAPRMARAPADVYVYRLVTGEHVYIDTYMYRLASAHICMHA